MPARPTSVRLLLTCCLLVLTACSAEPGGPVATPTTPTTPTTTSTGDATAPSAEAGPPEPDTLQPSDPPGLSYVSGRTLHRPDGSRLRLRLGMRGEWGVTSVVPLADGYLVTDDRWFEGTLGMQRLDARGRAVDAWASTGPARLGPGGQVAWMRVPVPEAGQTGPAVLHVDGRALALPGSHLRPRILQFDGALVVYAATVLSPGGGGDERAFEAPGGTAPRPVPMPRERVVSPGLTHWWGWRDGSLELGLDEAVLVRLPEGPFRRALSEPVWEDDGHLLATYVRRGRQALVRIGVDGSVTRTTDWVPATYAGHAVMPRVSR